MNLAAVMKAILMETWPGGASAPTVGSQAGNPLGIPNRNIDVMTEAATTAAIVATAAGAPPIPISTLKIAVDGSIDEIVGRYVSE